MTAFQDGARGGKSQQGRRKGRPGNARVQLSKRLTYALRHGANEMGLRMHPDGFVRLDELLSNQQFRGVSREQVEDVVASDEKGRMTIMTDAHDGDLLIRANQGHSVKGLVDEEQLLTKVESAADVPVCVHGTVLKSWPSIREEGLHCMNRTHIHFAAGLPGDAGVISGMRSSCKVFIYVDVEAAMSDGIVFFRSSNNVILTSGQGGTLRPSYFCRVDGVSDFSLGAKKPPAAEQPAKETPHNIATTRTIPPCLVETPGASSAGETLHDTTTRRIPPCPVENSGTSGVSETLQGKGAGGSESGVLGERKADEVDVYAVLDFEATCEDRSIDGGRFGPYEVIEFPTVLLDARSLEVLDEFRAYVRPVRNPTLTPFCTGLTGIQQATVDESVLFKEALHQHTEFLERNSCLPGQERSCLFVTCGNWDLKTMLPAQCKLVGLPVPSHLTTWANIKQVFQNIVPPVSNKRGGRSHTGMGMEKMLLRLGLVLEGRHHSGLDDCRNIAKIVGELSRLSGSRIRATTTDRSRKW